MVISYQLSVKEPSDSVNRLLTDNRKVFRRKTVLTTDNHSSIPQYGFPRSSNVTLCAAAPRIWAEVRVLAIARIR